MELNEILSQAPKNSIITDNLIKAYSKINSSRYKKILCSISGGADSDVILDICSKCDNDNKIEYVWFDTGIEYQATKDHLKYLEDKYGITIIPYRSKNTVPVSCLKYGQPFLSKQCSEMISRLQKHNFDFENDGTKSYEELVDKYPNCKGGLKWWCCHNERSIRLTIHNNSWLKEFMLQNPPTFRISSSCCKYAKKNVSHEIHKKNDYDLDITGIRRAEGGMRAIAYKSCFDSGEDVYDKYRPIFWYKDSDRKEYEESFDVTHSRCYTEYGFSRTGCAGCPFGGKELEYELAAIEKYEPRLYKAVNNIFKDSYEYTRQYYQFRDEMNEKYGTYQAYLRMNISA